MIGKRLVQKGLKFLSMKIPCLLLNVKFYHKYNKIKKVFLILSDILVLTTQLHFNIKMTNIDFLTSASLSLSDPVVMIV